MASANTEGEGFTRLVSGLERENDSSLDEPLAPVGWRNLPWIEGDGAANPDLWADRLAWLDLGDEATAEDAPDSERQEPAPVVRELGPADPAAITDELGLGRIRTAPEILRTRRAFALRNHPDLFPPEMRELATQRMRIANILTDAALLQTSHGRR
ncbi:MAG TPA: hypothetical protein VG271_02510 [Beijerinckiaceae bacterium]|jgi:hypothetical protein|nr:hypothetical protein [Beijerinckiaceae bacterium]